MKKASFWKALRFLPCLLFLAIMASLFLRNGPLLLKYTKETLPKGHKDYTQKVDGHLSENLAGKYGYINLNGGATRLFGINVLNDRIRLENGYMACYTYFGDVQSSADNIKALSDHLAQKGIPFLYTYIPAKEHSFDAQMPPGYAQNHRHDQVIALEKALEAQGVNQLNLDGWFQSQGMKMEDIYFRTDHHWLPEAAFTATERIMERLAELDASLILDKESLDPKNWTFEVHENWLLGSDGRKTGQPYAGIDDFTLIYPNYPVELYVGRVNPDRTMPELDTASVYHPTALDHEEIFLRDPYGAYLGNNYPYTYIRNELAVNDKKLLVIGDSYRTSAECFLTTQFKELFHVDMREYRDGSFLSLVEQIQPDQVLLLCCIPEFEGVQNFGFPEWEAGFAGKAPGTPVFAADTLQFEAASEQSSFSLVAEELAPGSYRMALDNAALDGGIQLVQFALRNRETGEVSTARYFLSDYGESQTWLFTVPEEGTYDVVAYHGMPGSTQGKSLELTGISIEPYI